MKITFGSDPELLIVDDNNDPKSAIDIIHGSPDDRVTILGHQFYYDNVLAECAVKPGSSKKEVLNNFKECLGIYADIVKPYKLSVTACVDFPADQLNNEIARKAGCAIDSCAYELKMKDPPKDLIKNGNMRSCGGHIHLGSELLASDGPEPILAIYMLDLFIGVSSLHLDRDPTSLRRRLIYGKAGRYRSKDYGLEYRSLGNFWLMSPKMTELIYNLSIFVHEFIESKKAWDLWKFDENALYSGESMADAWTCTVYNTDDLRNGIDTGNKDITRPHFDLAKELMPKGLRKDMQKLIDRDSDGDFYKNWGI